MKSKKKILVVEDETIVAMEVQDRLLGLGYVICAEAASGEEAIQKAQDTNPNLVLMDIHLEGTMDGIEAAEQIRERLDIPIVFLTAFSDEATLRRAKISSPFGYLLKPFDERTLHATIEMAIYRHEMEKKLKASEELLSITLRSIGDAVIATDEKCCITFMNPVAELITQWTHEESLGKDLHQVFRIISEETGDKLQSPVTRALNEGQVITISSDALLINKHDVKIPIDDSAAPLKDEDGSIIGAVLVFRDITERRQIEKEREKLIAELQKALNEVKTLSGLLPICSSCKKIRDDKGYWNQIEFYISERSDAQFSHGVCPECKAKFYEEMRKKKAQKDKSKEVVSEV